MKKGIAFVLSFVLLLSACGLAGDTQEQEGGYLIYYLAAEGEARGSDILQGTYVQLGLGEDAGVEEQAAAVVERLLQGPEEDGLAAPVPSGVELLSLEIRDRRAYVDLSGGFGQLSGVDLALADYCLALSLTALEGISAVSITVQGRVVAQQPKQVFYERDVLLSTMEDVLQTVEVTLYFLNSQGALEGERRTLEIYEGQTLAENLVAALLEGPQSRELTAVIPGDFTVNSIRVDSGVCYVNLSSASLASLPEDEDQQRLILWSLSDSLYSIDTVEELRLLADGEALERFGSIPVESVATKPKG